MSLIQYYIAEISKYRLLFFDREEKNGLYISVVFDSETSPESKGLFGDS